MESWKEKAKELRFEQGMSWSNMAKELQDEFPTLSEHQVHEKIRRFLRREDDYNTSRFVYTGKQIFEYEFDEPIHLYPTGDWHIGAEGCLLKQLEKYLDEVWADPIGYLVLTGDLCETATQGSKSSVFSQTMNPQKQKEKVLTLLDRFAQADRILFGTNANHEIRVFRTCGIDIMADIFSNLGILDRYNFSQGFIKIKIKGNKKPFNIYATHSLGKSETAIQNKCRNFVDVDLFIGGHIHTPKLIYVAMRFFAGKTREIVALIVTAWLQDENYAISAAYSISSMRTQMVEVGKELKVIS